jgi:hypothetical protein
MDTLPKQPPKLLDQMRERIRVKHYSIRTESAYVDWAQRFILFHGERHPREMEAPEVAAFLTHPVAFRSWRLNHCLLKISVIGNDIESLCI